jgi:nucleoside-diphosphate-sugar epimerase
MTRQAVLVIGASGFIGRRIVAALASTQWARPIAASRNIGRVDFGPDVERISLDATDRTRLQSAIKSTHAVVSCLAGSAPEIIASGDALFGAVSNTPEAPRVVYLSSIAAYGSAHGSVDESCPLRGDLGDYSAAKATVENRASHLPNVVRLRPGIVYGPESSWWSDRIARLLVRRRLGDLGPSGAGFCNAVHVDDVVIATLRAIQTPAAGGEAFNLGSPHPPTWNEYFHRYAQFLRATPVKPVSKAALLAELNLYGFGLKVAERFLGQSNPWAQRPAIRPWLLQLCKHDIRMQVRKAEQTLGMQWQALDAGLEQTAAWFLAGGRTA